MNYIKEINAFYQKQETNQLSAHAANLWHTLMHINNRTGWKKQFTVSMGMICAKGNLSQSTFKRARTELADNGYIKWESRGANRTAMYELVTLVDSFTYETSTEEETVFVEKTVGDHLEEKMEKAIGYSEPGTKESVQPDRACDVDDSEAICNRNLDDTGTNGEIHDHVDFCSKVQSKIVDDLDEKVEVSCEAESEFVCDEKVWSKKGNDMNDKVVPLLKQKETKQTTTTTATARVIHFFENNFCKITPYIMNELNTWINNLNESLVIKGMERALDRGNANWGYTKGILKAWVQKGILTVQEVEQEVIDYRMKREQRQTCRKADTKKVQSTEIVPDWFKDRKNTVAVKNTIDHNEEVEVCSELAGLIAKYA